MTRIRESKWSNRIVLASLLFGLFFGAGNLIFPIAIGQNAGSSVMVATLGFIVSGVGFTCLAVIACERSGKDTLESMLAPYGRTYALVFTTLLLLTIGPFFALPRTATVPYEVGIVSMFPTINHTIGLGIFSVGFFLIAYLLSLKPNKINTFVGKIINPLFLLCLLIFFVTFAFNSMGGFTEFNAIGGYAKNAFLQGFEDGYQTMDVLAALIFSFVIISVNKQSSSDNTSSTKDIVISSILAGIMMLSIYTVLAMIGASSLNMIEVSANGGIAMGLVFNHYFGNFGSFFLALTITLACLKTAIGLITSCSNFFMKFSTKLSYKTTVGIVTLLALVVSNFGLNVIIELALPVLKVLYPLAIMHVVMGLLFRHLEDKPLLIKSVLVSTLVAGFFEVLTMPNIMTHLSFLDKPLMFYKESLPLSSIGLAWVNFMVVGILFAYLIQYLKKPNLKYHQVK